MPIFTCNFCGREVKSVTVPESCSCRPAARVCPHGTFRRKCDICELEEQRDRLYDLHKEADGEVVRLRAALAQAQAERDKQFEVLNRRLEQEFVVVDGLRAEVRRLALCPDHRDKASGDVCIACQAEIRARQRRP